jgi:polysaccharide biosynthesis/export protein
MPFEPRSSARPGREPLLLLLVLLLVSAIAGTAASAQSQSPLGYVIGPKDVVSVACIEDTTLNGKFTVESDGTFTLPYIGAVKAAGLTVRQLEQAIKKSLVDNRFFRSPQITVTIDEYRSQYVIIWGEVAKPGPYPLTGGMTLLDLIAQAGTLTPSASGTILIVPATAAKAEAANETLSQGGSPSASDSGIVRADLSQLQRGILDRTIELHDGDTVIAQQAERAYIMGEVKSAGAHPVQSATTVQQLIALAGGQTVDAALNRIKIARFENGVRVELKNVKLTDIVKPGDTIIVPTKRW